MEFQFTTPDMHKYPPLTNPFTLTISCMPRKLLKIKFMRDDSPLTTMSLFSLTLLDLLYQVFQTEILLMWCDSCGNLYPVTTSTNFVGLTSSLWHSLLIHHGIFILHSLRNNKFICCEILNFSAIFDSCVLGKRVKLSFFNS